MADLTRRNFSSMVAVSFAALGMFSELNQPAQAQLVWKTGEWKLASFEELLGEKARVKQLFDITQVEEGASLAKIKNWLNGLHFGFGLPAEQNPIRMTSIFEQASLSVKSILARERK
jgi:hypothetical protein